MNKKILNKLSWKDISEIYEEIAFYNGKKQPSAEAFFTEILNRLKNK